MIIKEFLHSLGECPLVASVQASNGSAIDSPEILAQIAKVHVNEGVKILRLQGLENIAAVRAACPGIPCIGLIKRDYPGSEVYITATELEVKELLASGCEVIALDGTRRNRPDHVTLKQLIDLIHEGGKLAMADCDSEASADYAISCGADLVGTTLSGYTQESQASPLGPNLDLLRAIAQASPVPVIAEGRYSARHQVESALLAGAAGVVVGGALNDPIKQTRAIKPTFPWWKPNDTIAAVDIGGTWLRVAKFNVNWELLSVERTPNPHDQTERLNWIREQVQRLNPARVGVSTGGVIDPRTGIVWKAKEYLMPNHVGIEFSERTLGVPTVAWGDGHATAWGHGCLPQFSGKRVATIALGTGVGCGFVTNQQIWAGSRGEYPRLNDSRTTTGKSYEDLLGGLHFDGHPTDNQKALAIEALHSAVETVNGFYFPDDVVIAGSVGMSDWMKPHLEKNGLIASPFGSDAGIFGAAALALFGAEFLN